MRNKQKGTYLHTFIRIIRQVALGALGFGSLGLRGSWLRSPRTRENSKKVTFEGFELEKTRRKQLSKPLNSRKLEESSLPASFWTSLDLKIHAPVQAGARFSKTSVFSTLSSKKVSRSVLRAPQNAPEGSLGAPGGVPIPQSSPKHPQRLQRQPPGVQDVSTGPPAGVAAPF